MRVALESRNRVSSLSLYAAPTSESGIRLRQVADMARRIP